jgi:serine/threonine-protein kinase
MNKLIKIPLYIAMVILFGIVSGYLTFTALTMSRTVVVPVLIGKGMVEGNDLLRSKGLYMRLEGDDYDASVPQGNIIRQDIPAGSGVKVGREVRVTLSRGARIAYFPDVVGQPIDHAETILQPRGIKIHRVVYIRSETAAKGIILAQRPEPSERGGEQFSILVSLGGVEKKSEPSDKADKKKEGQ